MSVKPTPAINRRTVFIGVGAVGALAAATRLLPDAKNAPQHSVEVKPDLKTGGYQLTEHVKQYYATARI